MSAATSPFSSTASTSTSASPSSSSHASTSGTLKPIPKKRAKPCIACSSRKVACKGLDVPGATGCVSCVAHGIPCSGGRATPSGPTSSNPITPAPGFKPRKGSKISQLQKHAAETEGDEEDAEEQALMRANLRPTSSTARLEAAELGGALTYSLINAAFEEASVQSLSPLNSLEVVRADFRKGGMRTHKMAIEQEILLSCYIAIGSRRSSHSAIIGNHDTPGHLGIKRELACRTLAQRAIDLLETSDICFTPSMKNIEIVSAVKEMIIGVYPDHPFSRRFSPILHGQRMTLVQQGRVFTMEEEIRTGFLLYDARVSAKAGVRTYLADADLAQYHFGLDLLPDSILKLAQPTKYDPSGMMLTGYILTTQLALLRRVVSIVSDALRKPDEARKGFSYLWDMIDNATSFLQHKLAQTIRPPGAASINDILGQVPDVMLSECHLMRVSIVVGAIGEQWNDIKEEGKRRFLKALKWLSEVLASSNFTRSADVHWVARRLEMLEVVPNWVDIALAGADDPTHEFDREDLQRLLAAFNGASVVFASSSIRTDQIAAGLERMTVNSPASRDMDEQAAAMAATMVRSALRGISNEFGV